MGGLEGGAEAEWPPLCNRREVGLSGHSARSYTREGVL